MAGSVTTAAQPQALDNAPWMGSTGTNIAGVGASLLGAGLGAYNQQQSYNTLQGALNTIGPTQLSPYSFSGPGGMSASYDPKTGTANTDLGALNGAYGGLAGAGTAGAGGYNSGLIPQLTSGAAGTLPQSLGTLNSAYGNYGLGMNAANTQLGALNQTYNTVYGNTLSALNAAQTPQLQQQAFGLQNTLFGNGVLGGTGANSGAIAAANFGSQVNAQLGQNTLNAQQMALNAQTAGAQNYGTLSNSANGILSNALTNYGNTNQLISGLNTAGLTNSLSALQGAGALQTMGLNQYQQALQTGAQTAQARNMSLFPYASVATALSGTQNGLGLGANALSSIGSSLLGGNGGLTGLLQKALGGGNNNSLSSLFSGGSSFPSGASVFSDASGSLGASTAATDAAAQAGTGMFSQIPVDTTGALGVPDFLGGAGSAADALGTAGAGAGATGLGAAGVGALSGDAVAGEGLADISGSLAANGADIAAMDIGGDAALGGAAGAGAGGTVGAMGALGPAMAAALPLAIVAFGASQPAVTMGSNYQTGLLSGLGQGVTPGTTSGPGTLAVSTPYGGLSASQNNAINAVANSLWGSGQGSGGISPQVLQQIQSNPAMAYALNQLNPANMTGGGAVNGGYFGGSGPTFTSSR